MPKQLVVTADDFGAAIEVNEAVERAHRYGILTAASLMVAAPAALDAVNRARALPSLHVGLHVVLTEGRPVCPSSVIPDLVDQHGRFRRDLARMGAAIFFKKRVRRQVENEIEAQFQAFQATGLPLDHVNTHMHYHLHPSIAEAIVRIGKANGMRASRVPVEPRSVLARVERRMLPRATFATAPFARRMHRRFTAADIRVPDSVFGLEWSGAMNAARLRGLIANLPDGLSEIYLHPAIRGGFEGSAPGYRYGEELAALMDRDVVAAAQADGIELGGFSDFCGPL